MSRIVAAIRRILRTLNGEKLGPVTEMHVPTQDLTGISEPELTGVPPPNMLGTG